MKQHILENYQLSSFILGNLPVARIEKTFTSPIPARTQNTRIQNKHVFP